MTTHEIHNMIQSIEFEEMPRERERTQLVDILTAMTVAQLNHDRTNEADSRAGH